MQCTAKIAKVSQDDWKYAALQDIFDDATYDLILIGLNTIDWVEATKEFYIQRESNLIHNKYFCELFTPQILKNIKLSMESLFKVRLSESVSIVAHKMIKGDYIGAHTDINELGESHRLTIMLNDDWDYSLGGVFMTLDSNSLKSIRDAWLPISNTGIAFEISEFSMHAVSPITTDRPRYSLIFTFKKIGDKKRIPWIPFVLTSDLESAVSTASYMGINSKTFDGNYEVVHFETINEFRNFLKSELQNVPKDFSYASGKSINVDHTGKQRKGSDQERIESIKRLETIPPPIIVNRKDGSFVLVDGSHRISYANDVLGNLTCAFFHEIE